MDARGGRPRDDVCPLVHDACLLVHDACLLGDDACLLGDDACLLGDDACPFGDDACPFGERTRMTGVTGKPPVVILCGGRGTRLRVQGTAAEGGGQEIPKPLVEIGGLPIVWHVIQLYAVQGFERFLLATGYKGELIERFVEQTPWPAGVRVRCVDTGLDTPTGGRIKLLAEHLAGERFCATYADGLARLDLGRLLDFHDSHGALATMTVVRPRLQFGVTELDLDSGRVLGFHEKPRSEHWVNGGFFCFEPDVLAHLRPDSVLEREPLQRLAALGELRAHRHEDFWECMDTYKDAVALNDLWESGQAPWSIRDRELAAPRG